MSNQYNAYGHSAALYIYSAVKYVTLPFNGMTNNENNGGIGIFSCFGSSFKLGKEWFEQNYAPARGICFPPLGGLDRKDKKFDRNFLHSKKYPLKLFFLFLSFLT